jgi:hypothetical protein
MKTKAKILKIYRDGVLEEVRVIGDEDDYDRNVSGVTFKGLVVADIVMIEHWGEYYKEQFIKEVKRTGQYNWEGELCYIPLAQYGNTLCVVETVEIEVS